MIDKLSEVFYWLTLGVAVITVIVPIVVTLLSWVFNSWISWATRGRTKLENVIIKLPYYCYYVGDKRVVIDEKGGLNYSLDPRHMSIDGVMVGKPKKVFDGKFYGEKVDLKKLKCTGSALLSTTVLGFFGTVLLLALGLVLFTILPFMFETLGFAGFVAFIVFLLVFVGARYVSDMIFYLKKLNKALEEHENDDKAHTKEAKKLDLDMEIGLK